MCQTSKCVCFLMAATLSSVKEQQALNVAEEEFELLYLAKMVTFTVYFY